MYEKRIYHRENAYCRYYFVEKWNTSKKCTVNQHFDILVGKGFAVNRRNEIFYEKIQIFRCALVNEQMFRFIDKILSIVRFNFERFLNFQ